MKTLEDKILSQIYKFETKKTLFQLIGQISGILAFVFLSYLFISVFLEEILYFDTLDVLKNLTGDFEIARKTFSDTIFVIYEEMPKETLIFGIISLFIVIILILIFIKSFVKIRNKLVPLLKFWKIIK